MDPKDAHALIPRTFECYFKWQRGIKIADGIKAANHLTLK